MLVFIVSEKQLKEQQEGSEMPPLKKPLSALAVAVTMMPTPGLSQTSTANFNVQITIQAECQINSATNMDFGTNGVIDAAIDATSAIAVQCTDGVPYDISLNAGATTGGTTAARLMEGPGGTISYSLYSDAQRTILWGDTPDANTVPGTGTGGQQTFTVYGRVPPQDTPGAGLYDDTVTATLTY